MKTRDIIHIIESCAKNKVAEFSYDGLNLVFKSVSDPEKIETVLTPSAAIPIGEDRKFLEERERVENLLIEDPLEMERRIADGELVDEV